MFNFFYPFQDLDPVSFTVTTEEAQFFRHAGHADVNERYDDSDSDYGVWPG